MALVTYVFQTDCGANKAGDVVSMDAEKAATLVDAGILAEATEEDVNKPEDKPEEMPSEEAAITRAIKQGLKEIKDQVLKTTPKTTPVELGNFAQVKTPAIKSQGDLLRCMYRSQKKNDVTSHNRLIQHEKDIRVKSPAGMAESTNSGADGGYAVPQTWAKEIFYKRKELPRLHDMCRNEIVSRLTHNIPAVNETSLADGSRGGGILRYFVDEAVPVTSSYPAMTNVQATLKKVAVTVPFTIEVLEDNAYDLDKFVADRVGEEFIWGENKDILSGNGTTQPKGILNQGSLITVSKTSGQTAGTITFPNLRAMWKRLWLTARANAVWLVTPQAIDQLIGMTFPDTSGTYPAFGFVSWDAHEEFPLKVFGRPVVELQMAVDVGTVGDIILADLSSLYFVEHANALDVAISEHVYFTSAQVLYRWLRRYDVQSGWTAAVTSFGGGTTYSPFIGLQTRS